VALAAPGAATAGGRAGAREPSRSARLVAGTATQLSGVVQLSNESTYTRFATASYAAAIRTTPTPGSHLITHLRYFTPDYEAEQTYVVLSSAIADGGRWLQIRVPMRPNGRIGWVPAGALESLQTTHTEIVVSRRRRRLSVYRSGRKVFTAPVGIGHVRHPDWQTPPGRFWITESFPSNNPVYGPWAFGTSDYATDTGFPDNSVVGIHGTNEPQLIPGNPSHGCIRLRNASIVQLARYVRIGTPVWVQ